jgi:DNA-binding MarR family transcriptional regulator
MGEAEAEQAVGYLVKRVQQAFRRRSDTALRQAGVSMSQYAVMRALADHPAASAADLARLCFVTRQSLQDVLSGLRASKLVEDADTPGRGRARALQLTQQGRRRLGAAHTAVFEVEDSMLHGLSRDSQAQLAALLAVCAANLEAG